MFKGLRTKIESEQKGHSPSKQNRPISNAQTNITHKEEDEVNTTSSLTKSHHITPVENPSDVTTTNQDKQLTSDVSDSASLTQDENPEAVQSFQTTNEHQNDVAKLHDQLKRLIKERDESNDQNAQLYQLIEKLRRNLETEKETNCSLRNKLEQAELRLKEKEDSDTRAGTDIKSKNISIKPFDFDDATDVRTETIEISTNWRAKFNDLQNQLSEKNRQLKIRQQNMNDIKKALHREMADHAKTQEELCRLQNQLVQAQSRNDSTMHENLQNGSASSDIDAVNTNNLISHSDKNNETKDTCEESGPGPHLELISNLSSNASVDDFDPTDLHNHNKEVNHEYLRNVLFRYMTSTDSETTQHLIKAISVLVNFTPEQSAAVKSAMNHKSSWLRLKK